jgi:hypothetical protein
MRAYDDSIYSDNRGSAVYATAADPTHPCVHAWTHYRTGKCQCLEPQGKPHVRLMPGRSRVCMSSSVG